MLIAFENKKKPNCFEALDLIKCYHMIFEELIVLKMHYLPPLSLQSPFKRGGRPKEGPNSLKTNPINRPTIVFKALSRPFSRIRQIGSCGGHQ